MNHYDYIISGSGAAGLSLLLRMMQNAFFNDKKILVVDKEPKTSNDHTWCFWEKDPGLFEPVVTHQWQQVHFYSAQFSGLLDLSPYRYKMIRSADFYAFVLAEAANQSNITFLYGVVEATGNAGEKALVVVDGQRYTANYVFNSILFAPPSVPAGKYYLLQHFKGFVIETGTASFDPQAATLMDFRVSQQHGTTFMYVLPVSSTRALVEYTLFTASLLPREQYDEALRTYINSTLHITDYTIVEEEFGVIPMTNINYTRQVDRVINIGSAGGQTKASTGYTFQFIQKEADKIVQSLQRYGYPKFDEHLVKRRFKMYDSTLLNILTNNKMPGSKIFADMFQKNPAERVLRFLDNKSTLEDEINIMGTLPQRVFMRAALQEFFR